MNGKKRKAVRVGVISGAAVRVCNWLSSAFSRGTVSKCLSMHDKAREAYDSSLIVSFVKKLLSKNSKNVSRIRKYVARQFEDSLILNLFAKLFEKLLSLPGRTVGAFSLTWSAYVVLVYFIKTYALELTTASISDALCGILVFLSSIPLLFSEGSVRKLCSQSGIFSGLLRNLYGVPGEVLETGRESRMAQSPAVVLGILLGILTYFVSPTAMLSVFALIICVVLVMTYPEAGVIISISAAPFVGMAPSPSILLACFVLITDLAYLIKVVRGKRVFKFGFTELTVFGFLCAVMLSGFAPSESNTLENALLSVALLSVFFPAVGLMKNRHWIRMCAIAVVAPAIALSFIGISQYMLGYAPFGWVDTDLFGGITARAVSLFNNPNILGVYLVLVLPMTLSLTLPKHNARIRTIGIIGSALIVVCTVFTYSRSAWLGMLVGAMVFACMVSPKGLLWLIPIAGAAIVGAICFPESFGARLLNFFTLTDSANGYRIAVWNSSFNMLCDVFVGGIGKGEEAFKTAYVNFAGAGTQSAMHSHSLYMQLIIECGAVGLFTMLASVLSIISKCRSAAMKPLKNKELTDLSKAAIAGVVGLLAAGVFDYTWYNHRVFFIFWALLAIACSAVNSSEAENVEYLTYANDERSSFLTVSIPGTKNNKYDYGEED